MLDRPRAQTRKKESFRYLFDDKPMSSRGEIQNEGMKIHSRKDALLAKHRVVDAELDNWLVTGYVKLGIYVCRYIGSEEVEAACFEIHVAPDQPGPSRSWGVRRLGVMSGEVRLTVGVCVGQAVARVGGEIAVPDPYPLGCAFYVACIPKGWLSPRLDIQNSGYFFYHRGGAWEGPAYRFDPSTGQASPYAARPMS